MGTSITSSATVNSIHEVDVGCIWHEKSVGGFYGWRYIVLYKVCKRKRGRQNETLRRTMESEMKEVGVSWREVEKKAQDIVL